jgi:hypothetical protein
LVKNSQSFQNYFKITKKILDEPEIIGYNIFRILLLLEIIEIIGGNSSENFNTGG